MKKEDFYYETDWIHNLETENHWRAYWLQQKLINDYVNKKSKILEIGIGSSFCANYLKSRSYNITTLDIDKNKDPDIVANICLDKIDYAYSVILAFEVFEHIPFHCFKKIFMEFKKSKVRTVVMSIPESKFNLLKIHTKILNKEYHFSINILRSKSPLFLKKKYKLCKAHNWELNYSSEYTLDKVASVFTKNNFKIKHIEKSNFNNHIFFVLQRED